jgi:hypothetical protein
MGEMEEMQGIGEKLLPYLPDLPHLPLLKCYKLRSYRR